MFKKIKRNTQNFLLNREVKQILVPEFEESETVRVSLNFKGKVQGVGFRYETYYLALRLGLLGWVKNCSDGSVLAEVQGERNRIEFLISALKAMKRAVVDEVILVPLDLVSDETEFKVEM